MSNQNGQSRILDQKALVIIQGGDAAETMALAQNPSISPAIISELFPLYPDLIMANPAFAAAINNQEFLIEIFLENKSVIAGMKSLSFGWFNWLLKHPEAEVRQLTASNPGLPTNLHLFCSQSADRYIRIGLAANRGVSANLIDQLCTDIDPIVRQSANANPIGSGKTEAKIVVPTKLLHNMSPGQTTLQEPNMDFVDPSSNQTQYQDRSGLLQADSKTHPIIFVSLILGLFCTALGLMVFSKSDKPSTPVLASSPTPIASTLNVIEGNYGTFMADAMSIAVNNTAKSKTAKSSQDWSSVVDRWDEAIELLAKIPPQSSLYKAAQERLEVYKGLKSIARNRVK